MVEKGFELKMEQLLKRLMNGTKWLEDTQERLLAMEHVGIGSELEAQFLDAIELWDDLDKAVRGIYPDFQGCVLGNIPSCKPASPIRCRGCAAVGSRAL